MPRSRKAEYRVHLKTGLLETALKMFAEQGYDRTSLDHIAQALDVTKGSVYWHFQNKEDLLTQVIDYWQTTRVGDMDGLRANLATPQRRIETFVRGLVSTVNDQVVQMEFHQLARTMPPIRHRMDEVQAAWRTFLLDQLREAARRAAGQEDEDLVDGFLVWYRGLIWRAAEKPLSRHQLQEAQGLAFRLFEEPMVRVVAKSSRAG